MPGPWIAKLAEQDAARKQVLPANPQNRSRYVVDANTEPVPLTSASDSFTGMIVGPESVAWTAYQRSEVRLALAEK